MTLVPSAALDLSACDMEPICTPGSIQPHGFLLTLSPDLEVLQASANLAGWLGLAPEAALGQPLAQLLGADAAGRIAPGLAAERLGARPFYVGTITSANGRHFDVLGHLWDGVLVAEFEPVDRPEAANFRELYPLIGDFLLKVNETGTIESLAQLACQHIRSVTGFGRVMVYQFDNDGHGHVTAESLEDGYHSYLPISASTSRPPTSRPRRASCTRCRASA
jgi:light-regulated signal transduction histidine kinase (bacteriophytochrome)